jgi:Ca-activated chloride channel family protein
MHLLRQGSMGNWLVWSVVVAMASGCDVGTPKQVAAGAVPEKSRPGDRDDAMREQQLRTVASESEAKLMTAKSEEERSRIRAEAAAARARAMSLGAHKSPARLAPSAAPAPVEAAPPVAAYASRKREIYDDPLDGLIGGSTADKRHAAKPAHGAHHAEKAKAARVASVMAAVAEPAPPPTPVVRLDPNARYATTYRPGGAALAAMDAALARGTIPAVYRDLVGDFGARYAPPLAAPASGALAVSAATERVVVPPAGGPLHLRVALRSAPGANLARARLSVTLVLDVSGSMQGRAIENAKAAAAELVNRLDPRDGFALVTFSDGARSVVKPGSIGPRRRDVLARIDRIVTEGGTNVSAGLDLGYRLATSRETGGDVVQVVMLLSDGQANAGDTDRDSLAARSARAFQDGVQTSAFGLGDSFDAPLLASIADRGAGGYYYLADASQIAPAFARELDARLVPAALALEVRVRLRPEVAATMVYGSRVLDDREAAQVRAQEVSADLEAERRHGIKRDRENDAAGGMRFFIPSFARDDRHALLLALQLPPGVGQRAIGSVEVRYKDRLLARNMTKEIPLHVFYGRSDAESAATINQSVLRTVQAFAAGDAILAAAGRVDAGDRGGASRLLAERATLLQRAARDLAEPRFNEDGQRMARLATAVSGMSDPLALAMLLRGSGSGYLQ